MKALSQRSWAYVRTLVLPHSVSFLSLSRSAQTSKANLMQRSTPLRVFTDSWMATSSGVPFRVKPPEPT